ncbi:MAG: response regulator [Magnetococcales bacterium]|nr:response regulator [Magnetococcales bacterium]MBF0114169.1 response regulator [Magnetococcales bacterium]
MTYRQVSTVPVHESTCRHHAPDQHPRLYCSLRLAILLLLLLVLTIPTNSQASETAVPMPLSSQLAGLSATHHIRILEDPSRQLGLPDILRPEQQERFQNIGSISSRGISSSAWWVSLQAHNPSDQSIHWLLQVFHPNIDFLDIYHLSGQQVVAAWQLGDHRPFQNRPIAYETPTVPMESAPKSTSQIYLRYVFEEAGAIDTELLLWDADAFAAHREHYGLLVGTYTGSLIFISLYNLFIYLSTRMREYLWYVIYLAVYVIASLAISGIGHRYIYPDSLWLTDHFPTFMLCLSVIFGAQFTRYFLNMRTETPLLNRLMLLCMASMLLASLCAIIGPRQIGLQMAFALSMLHFLLTLVGSSWLWWRGYRKARLATFAWGIFAIGVAISWGRYMGYVPTTLLTLWSGRIASCLEAAILSFALADHINLLRQEKDHAVAREHAVIRRANTDLEIKVQERTQDLQQKNQELANERELLRATLESTHDGILAVGSDGIVTHSNHQFLRLFQFPAHTRPPGAATEWNTTISAALTDAQHFDNKLSPAYHPTNDDHTVLPCKDGRLIESYSVPLLKQGARVGRVWNFADVTQQKQYETQLLQARQEAEAANRSKSIFLASMSHEIRTPLNGILGMAELLHALELPPSGQEYCLSILSSGRSLLHIINDLLDYSKIEADKLHLEQIPLNLRALLQDVANLFRQLASKNGLQFFLQIDPSTPGWIVGDPTRLRQILVNLLANAIKFTPQGEVTFSATLVPGDERLPQLLFAIQDTGIGIAPDQFKKIFRSYEQAETSTTRQYGGTGLGLAITHQLTQLMQGQIEVESQLHRGSLFRVMLPCQPCDPPTELSAQPGVDNTPLALPADTQILVVEDDPVNRAVMRGMLKRWPIQVTFAHDGQQAIEQLSQNSYHLVFMDCQMPEMDGYTTCRTLRAMEESLDRHTPVIALTAFAMRDDRDKCIAAGMDDYLAKPVSWREIRSALQRWLATSA